jgi:hypothetical protein
MTAGEAASIAGRTAKGLNLPWGPDVTVTRLLRLWPFARSWRVVSRVPLEFAETTMLVNEATRTAVPRGVRYSRKLGIETP